MDIAPYKLIHWVCNHRTGQTHTCRRWNMKRNHWTWQPDSSTRDAYYNRTLGERGGRRREKRRGLSLPNTCTRFLFVSFSLFFSFENLINIYFDPSYGWPSVCDWAPSFELLNQKGNRTAGVEFVKLRDGQIDASPPVDNLNTLGVTNHVVLIWIIPTIKNNT